KVASVKEPKGKEVVCYLCKEKVFVNKCAAKKYLGLRWAQSGSS
ncbi:15147_t:CDS:1, partial [Dentiscutata erythropus]